MRWRLITSGTVSRSESRCGFRHLAQAEEESIPIILAEDRNTLWKIAERLRRKSLTQVRVLLLTEGFTPGRLVNPAQGELPLSPA
jgi:hypothetical protein